MNDLHTNMSTNIPDKLQSETTAPSALKILYQDSDLVAIAKPAGMLVHRSDIDRHETLFVVQLLRNQLRQRVYPIHRLDKPTAGVLLFALNPETAGLVAASFKHRNVVKDYLAVVRGYTDEKGLIDYALQRDSGVKDRPAPDPLLPGRTSAETHQEARTAYQRLAKVELPIPVGRYDTSRYSLLSLRPETGRRHQIRRHMKHIFHPIIGDTTHGDGRHNTMFRENFRCRKLLLMAHRLSFTHPYTQETIRITCQPDETFMSVITALSMGHELQDELR